jgi:hypothetical protein
MTRVHVVGAAGYAASEFVRLAVRHPELRLGVLESASHAGMPVAAHVPALRRHDLTFAPPGTLEGTLAAGDAVIFAGGAGNAALRIDDQLHDLGGERRERKKREQRGRGIAAGIRHERGAPERVAIALGQPVYGRAGVRV